MQIFSKFEQNQSNVFYARFVYTQQQHIGLNTNNFYGLKEHNTSISVKKSTYIL